MKTAIVIGSGISGLTTAFYLSKLGYRVTVLEQHYVLGGATHTFARHGYEWEVGLHYVGEVGKRDGFLGKAFDEITGGRVEWSKMDEVYDRANIAGEEYEFHTGPAAFVDYFSTKFPHEAGNIAKYVADVKSFGKTSIDFFTSKRYPSR